MTKMLNLMAGLCSLQNMTPLSS